MSEAAIICPVCSKPIEPDGRFVRSHGEFVHPGCLARLLRLQALERHSAARDLRDQARDLVEAARRLTYCQICEQPLSSRNDLLFRGRRLVHARCWPGRSAARGDPST